MSFHRVLVTSCRELLTLALRTPYNAEKDKDAPRSRRFLVVAVAAALLTLGVWIWWSIAQHRVFWNMIDLNVYYDAAHKEHLNGEDVLYEANFGGKFGSADGLPFIYPPFSALVFIKLLPLGFGGLKWLMTITSFASVLAVSWASWGMLGYRKSAGRLGMALLTFAAVVWLEPVSWTLIWGQVNLVLLAVIMLDLAQPDSRWWKGIGIGMAAGFKLTPAIFIVYLVMTRRFRTAAAAVVGFAATALLGLALLPHASTKYWTHIGEISGRVNSTLSVGTLNNQSLKGMLTRWLHNDTAVSVVWLVLVAAIVVIAMVAAAKASLAGRELLGVVIVGTLSLIVSPIAWSHHWVWVIPAFILLVDAALRHRTRLWWWATAAFFVFYASWPMKINQQGHWDDRWALQPFGLMWLVPRDGNRERRWNVWQFFVGNSYVLAGIALLLVVSWWVLRNLSAATAAVPEVSEAADGRLPEPASVAPTG
ncbi:glycosyltransferase 87 family protein [Yinghuangia seranimata]|uniref:glycosyltransferase 87 family protein n=1 Tax=Yinghuangia seranimata TaxID=408067 RepID=UPI00248B4ECE|nr:glycosyltransferase 87 family protein [Yinghuangia seranimata]MDI2129705.1 glycosyltransferase 87 family protein [Yinghuangia seranimata]